ncbi:BON domain-containing protein (plasmid) [Roseivivax marinus]|uniref:BON domain-containing protein n=1 Tax=Roseivivax marinus TaxID=1379903 RepID=UPI001F04FC78|nr:BON domain-containing protein [Roseivivax marinus]UMA67110.1 BON domain-containing protein [Roseivivax marinus]
MTSRRNFRAWSDQHPDPDTERGLGAYDDPREAERQRQRARELFNGPWFGPGMYPEVVAFPWAGTLASRSRGERPVWDRASDEVASWFGDDDAADRRARDYAGVGPKGYRRSDTRIEEDVNDALTDDPSLDASDIKVSVADREVTLDGLVRDRRSKRRAEDCAEDVRGTAHVQNNLRISDPQGGSEAFAPGSST